MKNNINLKAMSKSLLVATLAMLTMIGCSSNNSSGNGADLRTATGLTAAMGSSTAVPLVYDSSVTGGNSTTAGQGLLNESVSAGTNIGNIDPNSGMQIAGRAHFDSASPIQDMLGPTSYIQIAINGYVISVGNNSNSYGSVEYDSTNSVDDTVMVFQDQYGWIELQGTFNGNSFSGQVFYGPGARASSTNITYLGSFNFPTCSFFYCQ